MSLDTHTSKSRGVLKKIAETVRGTLVGFDVPVEIVDSVEGVRNYYIRLKATKPVRMRVVKSFEEDLRYALATDKVEIQAPLPNEQLIGVTVAKKDLEIKYLWTDVVKKGEMFWDFDDLAFPLGVNELEEVEYAKLNRLPHLLVGGRSGSGKSMLLHSIINSLAIKHSPDRLRFIMADPRCADLTLYAGLPHLLTDVLIDPKRAITALRWCIKEMDRRFDLMVDARVQNIASYHERIVKASKSSKDIDQMPYIIFIIDEISDFMAAFPRELESSIVRLTQKGRVAGIHVIISTQRPDTKVITGLIKANLPARIGFTTNSYYDSRVILDMVGAEKLEGGGDMFFVHQENTGMTRLQGFYISDTEILANKKRLMAQFETVEMSEPFQLIKAGKSIDGEGDDLYEDIKNEVIKKGQASTSYIQRKFRIGYSRAAHLMDMLEERGIIAPAHGATPRKVTGDTTD
jgi:S-DNA-T family DNA segregation ATPase FtsK/SpoIIIE